MAEASDSNMDKQMYTRELAVHRSNFQLDYMTSLDSSLNLNESLTSHQ